MEQKNTLQLSIIENSLTIDKAVNGSTLMKMKRDLGTPCIVKGLSGYLKTISEFFNSTNNLSIEQAIMTASMILNEYPDLTIEDIMFAMRQARARKPGYDKNYNCIDGSVIMGWIQTYIDERWEYLDYKRHQDRLNESDILKEGLREVFSHIDVSTIGKEKKVQPAPPQIPTFEKLTAYIIANVSNTDIYSDMDLRNFHKDFTKTNTFHAADKVLNVISDELNRREKVKIEKYKADLKAGRKQKTIK
jgi:hypothetical protein